MFDLFETLVTQKDPLYGTEKRIGISDILAIDPCLAASMFASTKRDRHEGRIKTRIEAIELVAQKLDIQVDQPLLAAYLAELDARKTDAFTSISPSVLEMLHKLRRSSIPTCVVTNCEEFEVEYYARSELPDLVDYTVFSCREGCAKPDAEIYRKAAALLNKDATECAFIGDGGTNELQGAQTCGIAAYQAWWYLKEYEEEYREERMQPFQRLSEPSEVLTTVCKLA